MTEEAYTPELTEERESFLRRNRRRLIGIGVGAVAALTLTVVMVDQIGKTGDNVSEFISNFDGDTVDEMYKNAEKNGD